MGNDIEEAQKKFEQVKKEFEKNAQELQRRILADQKELGVEMYPTNVVTQSQEVVPAIRIREIKNENTTTEPDIVSEKA